MVQLRAMQPEKFLITSFRPIYADHVNDWWQDHLQRYLTRRGFKFEQLSCFFLVEAPTPAAQFDIRLIAQRYGQTTIGILRGDVYVDEPLFT